MPHLLLVTAGFYEDIANMLTQGAKDALYAAGATHEAVTVPGALEIPTAVLYGIQSRRYHGYVALGCVIRGETTHYATVCEESARGLTWLALEHGAAIGNGILTVENDEQAFARADPARGNKGAGAAKAALALIALQDHFRAEAK